MLASPARAANILPAVWHIGFVDLEPSKHWLRRVLVRIISPPRHVVCFCDTPAGLLSFQQTLAGLIPALQPEATAASFAAEIIEAGGEVHEVAVPPEPEASWNPRPFTCVDVARSLALMPHRFQTPAGFARELRGRR